jgi:hypothetical protein
MIILRIVELLITIGFAQYIVMYLVQDHIGIIIMSIIGIMAIEQDNTLIGIR